ncbi:ATP-binding protein [Pseudoalteromonas sp. SMS1]|uniref:ATP-binding protein n=1 Tax=Pseudoalteromonas sp. SMS1 TaxID=2908894 RepID=UPI001F1FA9C7|nr:ATP-binding protein [Pseudoalteromonas sp. SMS1]MCF2856115.1 ATP-binding protein [Pseudoalteromonas sp. SMS1]
MSNSSFSFLASESGKTPSTTNHAPWTVLLVDDEPEIHQVTKMALSRFTYEDRTLEFLHAYSKREALEIMRSNDEISVILLDVIMETDTAGLDCVREIRHVLKNKAVRIILRTGQPSTIPEHEVMLKYDINDYKNKVDLTKSRLYIVMTSALRAYQDIKRQAELITALKDLNDNLEARVTERTSELQLANLELIHAKQQIIAQQQSLLQSEKMASIGQLAAGVAHEINNPLGAMKCNFDVLNDYITKFKGQVEALGLEGVDDDLLEIAEVIEDTSIDIERIEKIVSALSIFNGVSAEESTSVNIKALLEQYVATLSQPPVLSFSCDEDTDWNIDCCRSQLLQILNVLHINALESGSTEKGIELQVVSNPKSMHLIIKDQGEGIQQHCLNRIFDPFYTTKPVGQNLGLGLTIALVLVKNNNGKISVESKSGVGSCFDVSFSKGE